ncbi:MAG: BlaI/MecI/CopY family transcriptional regulator [Prevotella sp.]|jgi:predicted transcriptional regulator|nr:BlaI/MecI/CopY family transcriptional regulator [Prevotella sp.]
MKKLTQKEEEILKYFWQQGPMFVRDLLDLQEEPKPHYNTLSTIVRTLEEKGYIGFKQYGNTYQYYALISEDEYSKSSLNNVVDKYFANSYTRVVSTLIEEEKLSLDELQDLIRQIKSQEKK